jgi:hypothetical protein
VQLLASTDAVASLASVKERQCSCQQEFIRRADEFSSYGMLKVCGSAEKTGKAWIGRAREICSHES